MANSEDMKAKVEAMNFAYFKVEDGTDVEARPDSYKAEKIECDGRDFSFAYPLAPYGVAVFKF